MPEAAGSPSGLFFTGTDTGVGKTVVTAAAARSLRSAGRDVVVCKPVATGAAWVDGRWLADDTIALAEAAGLTGQWQRVTPWSFPDPVAPPLAAPAGNRTDFGADCRRGARTRPARRIPVD